MCHSQSYPMVDLLIGSDLIVNTLNSPNQNQYILHLDTSIHIHTRTSTYTHIHTHPHISIHASIHIHTHSYTSTHIHPHIHTYPSKHPYTFIHIHTYPHIIDMSPQYHISYWDQGGGGGKELTDVKKKQKEIIHQYVCDVVHQLPR